MCVCVCVCGGGGGGGSRAQLHSHNVSPLILSKETVRVSVAMHPTRGKREHECTHLLLAVCAHSQRPIIERDRPHRHRSIHVGCSHRPPSVFRDVQKARVVLQVVCAMCVQIVSFAVVCFVALRMAVARTSTVCLKTSRLRDAARIHLWHLQPDTKTMESCAHTTPHHMRVNACAWMRLGTHVDNAKVLIDTALSVDDREHTTSANFQRHDLMCHSIRDVPADECSRAEQSDRVCVCVCVCVCV
jgi:hypothetical protein